MMNGQYIEMRVNGASMICGPVSTVIPQWLGRCLHNGRIRSF